MEATCLQLSKQKYENDIAESDTNSVTLQES